MCYGSGCKWESMSYGPNCGECRKPSNEICPNDLESCEGCDELFEDGELQEVFFKEANIRIFVCQQCLDDNEDEYVLVL